MDLIVTRSCILVKRRTAERGSFKWMLLHKLDIMGTQKWAGLYGPVCSILLILKAFPLHAVFFKITLSFAVLHRYSESNKAKEISVTIVLFKNAVEHLLVPATSHCLLGNLFKIEYCMLIQNNFRIIIQWIAML